MGTLKLNHDSSEGNCEICDTGRIEETLEALARYFTFSSPEPTILLACGRNREALGAFSSPEPTILLACGRARELWLGPTQHRKSAIHGLPIKSDWSRIRNECSAHIQKIGSGQSSRALPQARRIVGSGDENEKYAILKFVFLHYRHSSGKN